MPLLTIIVATDAAGGIGINNSMPWHLPEDLAHFKRLTSGHPVIMGRKTFESIGRPLPNRRNIVVTRNAGWRHDGVDTVASLEQACALAAAGGDAAAAGAPSGVPPGTAPPAFIIGGAQIYAQALAAQLVDRLIVTQIGQRFDCDAFFPAPDPAVWKETGRQAYHSERAGFDYAFVTLERIGA